MLNSRLDITEMLYDICGDKRVYEENIDLIESGLLDSLALIELFSRFEEMGINIHITRIDRKQLKTVAGIQSLLDNYSKNQ